MNKLNRKELLERGLISDPTDDIGDMDGPYKYTKDEVDKRVKNTTWNGNYRTGYLNDEGAFVPKYVGRGVVNDRLKKHLDEGCKDTHFKFMYEADEIKSYEIESAGYHRFQGQIRNEIHPRKPDGMDELFCPYCGE